MIKFLMIITFFSFVPGFTFMTLSRMTRHKETRAALHCGKEQWCQEERVEESTANQRTQRPARSKIRDCQGWASPFRTDGRQKAKGPEGMADRIGPSSRFGRDVPGEIGFALKPHLLAPKERPSSVGDKLRFAAQRPRAGVSPFRSRFAPQRLKIALVEGKKGST